MSPSRSRSRMRSSSRVVLQVERLAPAELEPVERRLGDVDVAGLDHRQHVAEEERQDQRADVRAVDVGVRHRHDLVVAQALEVELLADARVDRRDHGLDLDVREDLVDPRLLDVEDLAAQRQDRLELAVARVAGGAAGAVALDEEELALGRVVVRAVLELARQARVLERRLAAHEVARLARGLAGARGLERLVDDRARLGRVLLEPLGERGVRRRLDEAAHRRVAELRLRLALELRVLELDRDDRDEALVRVVLPERLVLLLDQPGRARVGVDRARERGAEARQVRAALVRVDVVRERVHRRLVAVVPLHRDLDDAVLGLALERDLRLVRGRAVLVDVPHVVGEAVLGVELDDVVLGALVDQRQPQAARQEGHLALARLEHLEVDLGRLEDVGVGLERDRRAALGRRLALDELRRRLAAREALRPDEAVAAHLDREPLRERVDDRDADAVQAAGDLVAAAAELAAGVQHREHHLDGAHVVLLVALDRDAAAVVADADRAVGQERRRDLVAVPRESLVDAVVEHLVDEVMEAALAGRADVHAGAFPNRLEPLEHGDLVCAVFVLGIRQATVPEIAFDVGRTRMNTSNPAGRQPPLRPGTGPTRKRSAGSSQACSRRRASRSGARMREVAREHRRSCSSGSARRRVRSAPARRRRRAVRRPRARRCRPPPDGRPAPIRRARGRGSSRCPRGRSPGHHSGCAPPPSTRITRSQASPS